MNPNKASSDFIQLAERMIELNRKRSEEVKKMDWYAGKYKLSESFMEDSHIWQKALDLFNEAIP